MAKFYYSKQKIESEEERYLNMIQISSIYSFDYNNKLISSMNFDSVNDYVDVIKNLLLYRKQIATRLFHTIDNEEKELLEQIMDQVNDLIRQALAV